MTETTAPPRLPLWMKIVLAFEALAAAALLYIGMLIGSAFPMPSPSDIHLIGPLAMPLVAVPLAYLMCRAAVLRGRRKTAALFLFLPVAALLVAIR